MNFIPNNFGNALMLINRSEAYAEECTEQIFFGRSLDALAFIFMCRSEEWLQAEGIARKPRRKGRAEPAEDSTLPKPEPIEEVTPIRDITGGNKPAVGSKERTRPVLKRTRADSVAPLERAHKIPKRSKNSRISTPTGNGAAEKDSQWSKLKAEEGSSGLKVKEEMTEVKVEDLEETKVRAGSTQIFVFPLMCGKGHEQGLPSQKGRKSSTRSGHL